MTSGRAERQSASSCVQLSSGYRFKPIPPSSVQSSDQLTQSSANLPVNIANWPLRRQMFLLLSMTGLKPVGCLRHWRVLLICERMRHLMKGGEGQDGEQHVEGSGEQENEQDITPEEVWAFFHLLYNVNKVEAHISDNLPFKCKEKEMQEFTLPETEDFSRLLYEKVNSIKEQSAAAVLNTKNDHEHVTASTSSGNSNRNRTSGSSATPRSSTSSSKGDDGAFVVEPCMGSSPSLSSPTLSSAGAAQKRTHDSMFLAATGSTLSSTSGGGVLGSSSRAALSDAKIESPRSKLRKR